MNESLNHIKKITSHAKQALASTAAFMHQSCSVQLNKPVFWVCECLQPCRGWSKPNLVKQMEADLSGNVSNFALVGRDTCPRHSRYITRVPMIVVKTTVHTHRHQTRGHNRCDALFLTPSWPRACVVHKLPICPQS